MLHLSFDADDPQLLFQTAAAAAAAAGDTIWPQCVAMRADADSVANCPKARSDVLSTGCPESADTGRLSRYSSFSINPGVD